VYEEHGEKARPVPIALMTMIFPMRDTIIKHMIWIERSPDLPDVQVTKSETRKVANHTGAVRSKVAISPKPSVLTMVGKKYWNVWESRWAFRFLRSFSFSFSFPSLRKLD
jgi:hypothetical protein